MIGRISRGPGLAFGIAARAVAIAALAYVVLQVVLSRHLYATALVLLGVMAWLITGLVERIGRGAAERRRAEKKKREERATPLQKPLADTARSWQQQIDYGQTLLDTVAAALFVIDASGRASAVNRAAQRLATRDIHRLEDVELVGVEAARRLQSLPPGTRQIVTMADGRQALASLAMFGAPDLYSRRLISLQRIAGELDVVEVKAWQDVSRVLAHEMMNSLTPIASLSESLEQLLQTRSGEADAGRRNEEIAGALEAIRRRSHGLMEFAERYRQVAQLPTPELDDVRLADLISGIERLMAGTLRAHGITLVSDVSPILLSCRCDARLLEQLLINLLRNAIDAHIGSPVDAREARHVDVLCRLREAQIEIAVSDNGPGVPAGSEDQIFVPFFTTRTAGSGIGLSVARQIALAHGGRLEMRHHAPRGAAFVLTLPA